MKKNPLFVMWAKAAIDELKQNINENQKDLHSLQEGTVSANALKLMVSADKKAIEVYEAAIKENELLEETR